MYCHSPAHDGHYHVPERSPVPSPQSHHPECPDSQYNQSEYSITSSRQCPQAEYAHPFPGYNQPEHSTTSQQYHQPENSPASSRKYHQPENSPASSRKYHQPENSRTSSRKLHQSKHSHPFSQYIQPQRSPAL